MLRRLADVGGVQLGELAGVGRALIRATLGEGGESMTDARAALAVARLALDELAELHGRGDVEPTLDELETMQEAVAVLTLAVNAGRAGAESRAWQARQRVLFLEPGVSPTPAPPHGSGAAAERIGNCPVCSDLVTLRADGNSWRYRCDRCERHGAFAR